MSKPRLIIIGVSGHGRVAMDIAELNGYEDIVFLDDNTEEKEVAGYPVLGTSAMAAELEGEIFVAIGNCAARQDVMEKLHGRDFPILIHPRATIARSVKVGEGSIFMAGSVVNPFSVIGRGCIVNTGATVGHDCIVHDYAHCSSGSHIAGTTTIGTRTWVGIGTNISNNINICGDCMIGAGSVIVKDITEPGTYVGVPARRLDV